jgi:hypothetical protein
MSKLSNLTREELIKITELLLNERNENKIQQPVITKTKSKTSTKTSKTTSTTKTIDKEVPFEVQLQKAEEEEKNECIDAKIRQYEEEDRREKNRLELEERKEVERRKENNKKIRQVEQENKKRIYDDFDHIEIPEKIKQNHKNVKSVYDAPCNKCMKIKAFPFEFINENDEVFEEYPLCYDCWIGDKKFAKMCCIEKKKIICECGIEFYCPNEYAYEKHEQTPKHKKLMMSIKKKINFDVLTRNKLELIVKANLNADGTVKIHKYSSLKKPELLTKIKDLPNLIIPNEIFK